jgi:hypothetical protein
MPRFLFLVCLTAGLAQQSPKPYDPAKGRVDYSFPVVAGVPAFRFHVQVDPTGVITGVAVFAPGAETPLQTLVPCDVPIAEPFNEHDQHLELLRHADLNFDGFEDVELLRYLHPHLGTEIYCIYLWDPQSGRFRDAPEDFPSMNPVVHPESRTLTVHRDWMGGIYADTTFWWNGAKYEEVESSGRSSTSDDPKCSFTDHCVRLINGKMVTTLQRPVVCKDDRVDPPLYCPLQPPRRGPRWALPSRPSPALDTYAPACMNVTGYWADTENRTWTLTQRGDEIWGTLQAYGSNGCAVTWLVSGKMADSVAKLTAANPHRLPRECGLRAANTIGATLMPPCVGGTGKIELNPPPK